MTKDWLIPLLLFTALVLVLSLHGLAASGHFPRGHRSAAISSGAGPAVLYGSIAMAMLCVLIAIVSATRLMPWYVAIIGGGFAVLSAPLLLQQFSDQFVDGPAALVCFAVAGTVLALILLQLL